jgi:UDP-N-acetylglucosamine 2-epimerase (non-hydrolysing)
MKKLAVAVIVGTRPEAIKMAPVIQALQRSRSLAPVTVCTSQHRHMVHQVFRSFGIGDYHDLQVMRQSQTLWDLSGRLATKLGRFFLQFPAQAVLVQGDTSSAFFGGLCAYYHKIPVGHIEAGLRTGNRYCPFPEEMNRTLIGAVATWHFAPTRDAVKRLTGEGVAHKDIYVTGNTVVDALRWMAPRCSEKPVRRLLGRKNFERKLILVTCHRRESLGKPMGAVADALGDIARRYASEVAILFPVHPNPAVREVVMPALAELENIVSCEPLDYEQFLAALKHAYFVISDSGGVQEEATALGKPVLVLRSETERQEGVRAGALKLVGTDRRRIVREAGRLMEDRRAYERMCRASNIFGDGRAAQRIVRALERSLRRA